VAWLVQARAGELVERPQHAGRPEVDAVDRVGRLAVVVERVQRPPLPVAQRLVGVARDGADLRLGRGAAPLLAAQRLVCVRVVQHADTVRSNGRSL
jgi:hypothetical protein